MSNVPSEQFMANITARLDANRAAVDELIQEVEKSGWGWTKPRAEGKWSPSQVVEHVARSLEEGANVFAGRKTRLPTVPFFLRPVARVLIFQRVLRNGKFSNSKTNKPMDPIEGPNQGDARKRLEDACNAFEQECQRCAKQGEKVVTPFFGKIPLVNFVRFTELHTRHHTLQIPKV